MPVLDTRQYTDQILPQIWEEIDSYLFDVSVKFVLMDSGSHEDYADLSNHPELVELQDECDFEFHYEKVKNPSQSVYRTWNEGVAIADADTIMVISNDVLIKNRAIYDLYGALETGAYDIAVPATVNRVEEMDDRECPHPDIVTSPGSMQPVGWCFALTADWLESIGGFNGDYRLFYGDTELFARALTARPVIVASSGVFHYFSRTVAKFPEDEFKTSVRDDYEKMRVVESRDGLMIEPRSKEEFEEMLAKYWHSITTMKEPVT